MKKVIDISWLSAFTFFMLLTLSSCLEAGLDELESYNDAEDLSLNIVGNKL